MLRTVLVLLACAFTVPGHAQIPVKSYGQELVDQVVARTPGLLVVAMHASAPKMPDYPIVASNIGRYGKPADEDDMRVINNEKSNLEAAPGGPRCEAQR